VSGDVLLQVNDIRAGFGVNTVLHGVHFEVREGEIAGVFGLNGAGKSVTMKVIAGVVPARGGSVLFAGKEITKMTPEARVAAGIANVPQGRQVFADLSVEQNLRIGAYVLRRRDRGRYKARLAEMYERFPILGKRKGQAAGTMSGGEQASLAVARALMSEPRLILVDEPSAGLAPLVVEELFATLRSVNETGVTILLVEQNVTFGLKLVDTANVMQTGRIVYQGETASLDRERVADYLGIGRLLGRGADAALDAGAAAMETVAAGKGARRRKPKRRVAGAEAG
jgi:branched-chain amino acid transport system ATP-binding protein